MRVIECVDKDSVVGVVGKIYGVCWCGRSRREDGRCRRKCKSTRMQPNPTRGRVPETAKSYKNNPKIGFKGWSKRGPEVFFSHQ